MVLGDREFVGQEWVNWLKMEKISYCLRLREMCEYVIDPDGKMVHAYELFHKLRPGKKRVLGPSSVGLAKPYYTNISGLCRADGSVVVLMHSADVLDPCEIYRRRWEIEVLFRAIKSGGFDLESTHVTRSERLNTLLGIVALGCCIAYRCGIIALTLSKPTLKKHGYRLYSIIRCGLDELLNLVRAAVYKALGKSRDKIEKFRHQLTLYFSRLITFVM